VILQPILFVLPLALGAIIMGTMGVWHWKRTRDHEARLARAQQVPLPEGAALISTRKRTRPSSDRSGRLMLVLDGSFGTNLSINLLKLIHDCGLEGLIGSILLVEFDVSGLERFFQHVPRVFRDRTVATAHPNLSAGLSGRSPQEVQDRIEVWGPTVERATQKTLLRHHQRQAGMDPGVVLVFVSQGGHATVGTLAVRLLARQCPDTKFFGFTAIPVDDRLAGRVPEVLKQYVDAGVHGFVVGSNLRDTVANDAGMIATIVGFAAAVEESDSQVHLNNGLVLLFPEQPGGLVTYNTYLKRVAGFRFQPDPIVPPTYYVHSESVVTAIRHVSQKVTEPIYNSLGLSLNGHVPGTSRFEIILSAIEPGALKEIEDTVVRGRTLAGESRRNYHLLCAPIVQDINPTQPVCLVADVYLWAIPNSEETLRRLTAPEEEGHLLPYTNGRVAEDAVEPSEVGDGTE
jgi:hypothetical protein